MTINPPSVENPIFVRSLDQQEEFRACVDLQRDVWKFDELDLVPRRVFTVTSVIGGQVMGAFDGDDLVGFAMSLPGVRNGRPYLHSHMLAVRPQYHNRGIGAQLKWAQREDALVRGIELMEWTFDPLVIKNAHFNIEKLGAVARRYTPNFYGPSTSAMHNGLPTDRLHAEWWLRSKRVERTMKNLAREHGPILETITVTDIDSEENKLPGAEAAQVQANVRRSFLRAFSRGLTVLRHQVHPGAGGSYHLGQWDETWEH